jgi:hypothetical protein
MFLQWPMHDPGDTLDYSIDWSQWLSPGDTILTSTWSVPSGLIIVSSNISSTGSITVAWIKGAGSGSLMQISNTIVTSQGRTAVKTVTLPIGAN